jgi:hypothetical protein
MVKRMLRQNPEMLRQNPEMLRQNPEMLRLFLFYKKA